LHREELHSVFLFFIIASPDPGSHTVRCEKNIIFFIIIIITLPFLFRVRNLLFSYLEGEIEHLMYVLNI
jgi:hypothetical protein